MCFYCPVCADTRVTTRVRQRRDLEVMQEIARGKGGECIADEYLGEYFWEQATVRYPGAWAYVRERGGEMLLWWRSKGTAKILPLEMYASTNEKVSVLEEATGMAACSRGRGPIPVQHVPLLSPVKMNMRCVHTWP